MVGIVIPCYGKYDLLEKCINAIKEHTKIGTYKIVIVDDCYEKPLEPILNTKVVRNDTNCGFTKSVNRGIKECMDCDQIVIMNTDVKVEPVWLEGFLSVIEMNKNVGIVGGMEMDPASPKVNSGMADLFGGHNITSGTMANGEDRNAVVHDEISFSFSCVMLTKELIVNVGLLDERFKTWCSDSDYCMTSLSRGYRNIYTPNAKFYHLGNGTIGLCQQNDLRQDQTQLLKKWCGGSANEIFEKIYFNIYHHIHARVNFSLYDKEGNIVTSIKHIFEQGREECPIS